jgi:hypothetical protein
MSMLKSFRGGLFSCVHLLFVLILLATGFLAILSYFTPNIELRLIHLLLTCPNLLLIIGGFISFFALILLVGFFNTYKRRYFTIKMGASKVLVEGAIIQDYIKGYWKKVFPGESEDVEIIIHPGQMIEIVTKGITNVTQEIFDKIEDELGLILAKKLGYNREFLLTVTLP